MEARQKAGWRWGALFWALALALPGSWRAVAQSPPPTQPGNPFDPSGYLTKQGTRQIEAGTTLLSRGVYRINGRRYLKYTEAVGSVYLPAIGEQPDLTVAFAVCPQHLGLMREVLRLRDDLAIDGETRAIEPAIVALIAQCQQGLIASPIVRERQPDGAVVERQAKGAKNAAKP